MANDDVIVKFRADVSEMQSNIESAKKSVTDFSKETERAQNKIISANKKTASSFNGLGNSINQLTRELPAFTYSAQTGILALSNNIPALADQIQMLKVKNQELVASGQKAIPVWKSLTSALFSWQTLLSVGVTLVTLYGGKMIEWLGTIIDTEKKLSELAKTQKALNDIQREGAISSAKESFNIEINRRAIESEYVSREIRLESIKKLREMYPKIFKDVTDEALLTGKATDAYKKLGDAIKAKNEIQGAGAKVEEIEKSITELKEKQAVVQKKYSDNLKEQVYFEKAITLNGANNLLYTNKLAATKAKLPAILKESAKIDLELEALALRKSTIEEEMAGKIKQTLVLEKEKKEKEEKALTEREKILKRIAELEVKIQNAVILKGKANDKDKDALRDQLNLLNQIDDEYERIMLTIGDVSRMSFINKDNIEEFKKRARDVVKAEREIQLKANEDKTKDHAEQLKKESEDYKAFMRKKWDLEIQQEKDFKALLADSATNLSNSYLDITGNFVQSQIDGITTAKEANIQQIDELLERGIISQKQYDDKKTKLEREADSRTRDLLIKQFEREKAVKTAQAIMDGVLAVQKAYAELGPVFGLPAAIAIGVVSAANVVAIQTQPLPKFEKGGWVKGKRHRDGGVLIEAEDKEFINNRISSQKYSEELESMNNLSFEKLNYRKHIMPAIRKEREKIYSAINSSFNDSNLLMSDRETRQILRDIRDGVKQNSGYSKSLRFK